LRGTDGELVAIHLQETQKINQKTHQWWTPPPPQFNGLLLAEPVISYLRGCSQATPTLSHTRAWLVRHEHHLLYLLLRLAHRLVRSNFDQCHYGYCYYSVVSLFYSMFIVLYLSPTQVP